MRTNARTFAGGRRGIVVAVAVLAAALAASAGALARGSVGTITVCSILDATGPQSSRLRTSTPTAACSGRS